jgi:hypothetical protein
LTLLAAVAALSAFGQECGENLPPVAAFGAAAIVFRGTVERVEDPTSIEPTNRETGKLNIQPVSGYKMVTFRVNQSWKGQRTSTVQVFVLGRGFVFKPLNEYVVYAVDEVNQNWPVVSGFAKQSKVYGIGVGCVMRVRADVEPESKILDALVRRGISEEKKRLAK